MFIYWSKVIHSTSYTVSLFNHTTDFHLQYNNKILHFKEWLNIIFYSFTVFTILDLVVFTVTLYTTFSQHIFSTADSLLLLFTFSHQMNIVLCLFVFICKQHFWSLHAFVWWALNSQLSQDKCLLVWSAPEFD